MLAAGVGPVHPADRWRAAVFACLYAGCIAGLGATLLRRPVHRPAGAAVAAMAPLGRPSAGPAWLVVRLPAGTVRAALAVWGGATLLAAAERPRAAVRVLLSLRGAAVSGPR
jgi:hypothetical protein